MSTLAPRRAALGLVVAVIAATGALAQSSPSGPVKFDNGLLPRIPSPEGRSAAALAAGAQPALKRRNATEIAPGVLVDNPIDPECVFIANQSSASNVTQTAEIGSVTLICR